MSTRIKELRASKKLLQIDLAKLAGVSINTVRRWESGERSPRSNDLEKLAGIFNVTTDYLMGRAGSPEEIKKEPPALPEQGEGMEHYLSTVAKAEAALNERMIDTDDFIMAPVLSRQWVACCGKGIMQGELESDGEELPIKRTDLHPYDSSNRPFWIDTEGDCLESARIYDGNSVAVNPAETPADGAIALVHRNGSLSLKRIYHSGASRETVVLRSDLGEVRLTPEQQEEENFYVFGPVVDVRAGRPRSLPY